MTKILSDEQIEELYFTELDNRTLSFARAIEAAVLEAQKQEPVAWCVAYDDPRMGRIHSNPTMYEPEVDTHVSKCGGVVVKVPLYAAPVVQPDMVMVPKEPTEAMLKAIEKQWMCGSQTDMAKREYRAMIAAAEGK